MERVFLGLGSNVGDRSANIARAKRLIGRVTGVRIVRVSPQIETKPVGYEDQPDFINAVVEIETALHPHDLLSAVKRIEREMGREETFRFGPRSIDIDILLYGDRVVDEPDLTIPHPRMHERLFVLEPLARIAPEVVHPVIRRRVVEIRDDLAGRSVGDAEP